MVNCSIRKDGTGDSMDYDHLKPGAAITISASDHVEIIDVGVECSHCGQYGTYHKPCLHCGAPIK